ncbi:MAG TPA: hypothetical protein VFH63_07035 [candidate division Zixibacteria bacterium]|nr:hypothetical protein [candidate division Zixibacteria bacterium]
MVGLLLGACTTAQSAPGSASPSVRAAPSSPVRPQTDAPSPSPEPTPVDASVAAGLAFVRPVDGVEQVFVVEPDGFPRQVSGLGEWAAVPAVLPFWSRDRSMLALRPRSFGAGNQPQLMVVNADGSGQRALDQVGENGGWSPDSRYLLFEDSVLTTDTTGQPARIWLLEVATGEARVIGRGNVTQWLPDGEHISYVPVLSGPVGDTVPVMVLPLAGGAPFQVAEAMAWWWSPDGEWLLLRQPDGLYLAEPDGSNARFLVEGGNAAWSPDGTRIAFQHGITAEAEPLIGVVDLEGNVPWSGQVATRPAWSPDGTRIAGEVGLTDSVVTILDAANGEVLWELEGMDPAW